MGTSTTANVLTNPLAWVSLVSGAIAVVILLWFLLGRPPLDRTTKLLLLMGIFVFPMGSAMTGNVVGYNVSMEREFCESCHVMKPWTDDSKDLSSSSLASRHGRNAWFGGKNCYTCHADYEMYGTIATKINGMAHVYHYLISYSDMPLDHALKTIKIYKPFQNKSCMQCHSTATKRWNSVRDHKSAGSEVRTGQVSCVSYGCHGPAHPESKLARGEDIDPPPSGGPVRTATTVELEKSP